MQEFDLFVIGAGSGGVRCARIAARHGARVAIAERRHWGGTCVNLGCVPKKLMVYAAETGRVLEDASGYGWHITRPFHDWPCLISGKDREIARLNGIYVSLLEKSGVTLFTGEARLRDVHTVEIGPSALAPEEAVQQVRAKKIVLATGSAPVRLDIPGAELAITSDDIFHLPERPQRVAVIGGGYIGVEFAGILAGLGAEVDIVYRQNLPLRGFDGELRSHLHDALDLYGIRKHAKATPERIDKNGDALRLALKDGTTLEVDAVMMATGRRPAIEGLGLDAAGVVVREGRMKVDENFTTSVPSIYAIGDAIDRYNLTPTAIAEGQLLAEQLFAPQGRVWSFETTPKAVFFSTPLASVGLTEEEAARQADLAIYTASFTPMRQILPGREGKVFMKLVVDAGSDVVLGAHMMGPDAPEIMQMMAIVVTARLTKQSMDQTIALHPSTAEEFVTMRTPTRYVSRQNHI